jgi:hypothetical protein
MTDLTGSLGANAAAGSDEELEYGHRMVINVLATVAITFLIITGYWVVNTLMETMGG